MKIQITHDHATPLWILIETCFLTNVCRSQHSEQDHGHKDDTIFIKQLDAFTKTPIKIKTIPSVPPIAINVHPIINNTNDIKVP